ncbi:MAG: pirin family protein [Methylococcales bacterium]
MIQVRRADDRGVADLSWLLSRHTFSFGNYYDPRFMGFGLLRVINEDRVQPGKGFQTHGHKDMEIISYVIDGELEHQDTIGNGSIIHPGELQRMSAGSGVRHSEFNPSDSDPVHFLQIWILPERSGIDPSYEQKTFPVHERRDSLRLIGSPEGRDGSLTIHQDVNLYACVMAANSKVTYNVDTDRNAWVQIVSGNVTVNDLTLRAGDGLAVEYGGDLTFSGAENSEFLLFDLLEGTSP